MSKSIHYFVFDIETVSDGRLIQRIRYPDQTELSPPEAIDLYRQEILKDTEGKSEFIPWTFQIPISLSIAKVSTDFRLIDVASLDRPHFRPQIIVKDFWNGWEKYDHPKLVTFNGRGFDLPVLELAAYRYGISLKFWFDTNGPGYQHPRNRFNTKSHLDLMELLSNTGSARITGGLHLCSTLLGKPGKMATKGYMVQELWDQGEKERIDDYCICDTLDTYFTFLRTRVLTGEINIQEEHEIVEEAHQWIKKASQKNNRLKEYLEHFSFWNPYEENDSPFIH